MSFLVKIGQFFRVLDDDGLLSLTNISVMISLYKLLTAPATSYVDVGTVVTSLLAYTAKKVIQNGGSSGTPPTSP
jgi:hypothetical protein